MADDAFTPTSGAVPTTLREALDPAWLTMALAPVSDGSKVRSVEVVETIRTMATKVRIAVEFDAPAGRAQSFCIKAFLDVDAATAQGGATTVREADFYRLIAPIISVRTPTCVNTVIDRENQQGVVLMRDLIADGARFCTALEAFTVDQAAQSLEQIARLHAAGGLLDRFDWIDNRVMMLANSIHVTPTMLQDLLDGPRGERLSPRIRDASLLISGVKALAALDAKRPATLVHGDVHAGNIFQTAEGPGLIDWQLLQKGGWALDVVYHINAVLDVAVAEREERRLLAHYLDVVKGLGGEAPTLDAAWEDYRASAVYGYYLWAITRRVDPEIINVFVPRLGSAVDRHDSYRLLGV